ncbi:MAG: hypothetical protein AB1766_00150 [Pseudomonadota bacterium]
MKTSDTAALIRAALGKHPEDVIASIRCTADALFWLETLFDCIRDTPDNRPTRIKHLAEVGKHIAADLGNYADSTHEELTDSLRKAGLIKTGG